MRWKMKVDVVQAFLHFNCILQHHAQPHISVTQVALAVACMVYTSIRGLSLNARSHMT